MLHSVHLAPMQTLPLSCVRTAHPTVTPAWTPVITASAVPKAAINYFSTRGVVGRIARSKQLAILSSRKQKKFCNVGVFLFAVFPSFCLISCLLTLPSGVSLRQLRVHVKPVTSPV